VVRDLAVVLADAGLPVVLGTLKMPGHLLLYRKGLAKRLNAKGRLDAAALEARARALAAALRPA
jgi:hypothetical protein